MDHRIALPDSKDGKRAHSESGQIQDHLDEPVLKRIKTEPPDTDTHIEEKAREEKEGEEKAREEEGKSIQGQPEKEGDPLAKLLTHSPKKEGAQTPSSSKANLPKLDMTAAASAPAPGSDGATPLFDTPTTPHPSREMAEQLKAQAEQEEREKMQLLVSSFTEDQLDRYAMYRRAALPKATIRKIMMNITGTSVGHNVVIAMAGIAKVFAGEVVEEALQTLDDNGESGQPLKPKHLREALRKMRAKGAWVPKAKRQCPFN